jgi:hypothetical protein
MRISALTIAGVFFLFIGIIEIGAGWLGFAGSAPIFGAIGSPGLWGVLVGLVLIVIGTRKRGFSRRKSR